MTIERIDFDAEDLAAENFTKDVKTAIALTARGGPERPYFVVRHSVDLGRRSPQYQFVAGDRDTVHD